MNDDITWILVCDACSARLFSSRGMSQDKDSTQLDERELTTPLQPLWEPKQAAGS